MRLIRRICGPKVWLSLSNITLLGCACALLAAGCLLFVDNNKLLISKLLGVTNDSLSALPKPLFYYAAVGLAGAGLIGLFAALLGCCSNCWTNYCTLTLYFLVVFVILICEFVFSISISIWPHCLGLNLEEDRMVRALQGQYGVSGHEQFTAAIDLVQTEFRCCGISSDINYDTSFWRLQDFGNKDLVVPLTCCILDNDTADVNQYLDPKPMNLSLCQSLQRSDYSKGRHLRSCLEEIELWYHQQYIIFLGIISVVALVNFFVLLSIIYSCTTIKRQRKRAIDQQFTEFERKVNDRRSIVPGSSTGSSPIPDNRDHFVQPQEYNKQRNVTTFRAEGSGRSSNRIDFRGTKSYLV